MVHIANSIPMKCPNCGREQFNLFRLTITCLHCGWCRKLIPKGRYG